MKAAEKSLVFSLLRGIRAAETDDTELSSGSALAVNGTPDDHARYYRDPRHLTAFAFLPQRPVSAPEALELSGLSDVHTILLSSAGEFPAVAYAYSSGLKTISWGLASIVGGNPWPHPLA